MRGDAFRIYSPITCQPCWICLLTLFCMSSYRQSVPVDFIVRELAFESTSKALEFLNKFSLIYTGSNQTELDCKASLPAIASI